MFGKLSLSYLFFRLKLFEFAYRSICLNFSHYVASFVVLDDKSFLTNRIIVFCNANDSVGFQLGTHIARAHELHQTSLSLDALFERSCARFEGDNVTQVVESFALASKATHNHNLLLVKRTYCCVDARGENIFVDNEEFPS